MTVLETQLLVGGLALLAGIVVGMAIVSRSSKDFIGEMYALALAERFHILREVKAGRIAEVEKTILRSLPQQTLALAEKFNRSPFVIRVLQIARQYYEKDPAPPQQLMAALTNLPPKSKAKACYDLVLVCTGDGTPGCTPVVTSLRPVNLKSPNPDGWEAGSACAWKRRWWSWAACGDPLGIDVCID
jgi:hypothetical protein